MSISAPLKNGPYAINPEWIDYNGHFNMAYYNVLFDRSSDVAFSTVGLGPAYLQSTGNSYFTLEAHITYLCEIHASDTVFITMQILDCDAKRIHYVQQMYHAESERLACVCEAIVMHMDMTSRKPSAFPAHIQEKLLQIHKIHSKLPIPAQVGHRIGIIKKI